MIPDSLDFILRPVDEQQAEYAAAHQTSVTPAPSLRSGVADTDSSDADAVGAPASEVQTEQLVTVPANANTPAPRWSAVDDDTADLLSILSLDGSPIGLDEWPFFLSVLEKVASENGGLIDQNHTRPLLHGEVRPARIGAFFRRACREGRIRPEGYTETTNSESGNTGRPARSYRWLVA